MTIAADAALPQTNLLIYPVEGSMAIRTYCLERLRLITEHPTDTLLTSSLAYVECVIQPIRSKDADRRARFEAFFSDSGIVVADVSNDILGLAGEVRARHSKSSNPTAGRFLRHRRALGSSGAR